MKTKKLTTIGIVGEASDPAFVGARIAIDGKNGWNIRAVVASDLASDTRLKTVADDAGEVIRSALKVGRTDVVLSAHGAATRAHEIIGERLEADARPMRSIKKKRKAGSSAGGKVRAQQAALRYPAIVEAVEASKAPSLNARIRTAAKACDCSEATVKRALRWSKGPRKK
jgi:hypothetical protein